MILTFKEQFVQKILDGTKETTIREDKTNRWKSGQLIHFWKGNPRNTTTNPYQFGTGIVTSVHPIVVSPKDNTISIYGYNYYESYILHAFAELDGFDSWEEMKTFFPEKFTGKRITWTDFHAKQR